MKSIWLHTEAAVAAVALVIFCTLFMLWGGYSGLSWSADANASPGRPEFILNLGSNFGLSRCSVLRGAEIDGPSVINSATESPPDDQACRGPAP